MKLGGLPIKLFKWTARAIGVIVSLFLLLVLLLYLPPVQQWAKNLVCDYLSEDTGMEVKIERVRLSFPLDLMLYRMSATEGGDTVVAAQELLLDVKLLPLLSGKVDLNGFELRKAQVNSKSYISDTHIEGCFKLLAIDRTTVCDLNTKRFDINKVRLRDADVSVILSDTAQQDTTPSQPAEWAITLNEANIKNTRLRLQMPGDSMRVAADLKSLRLVGADLRLHDDAYKVDELVVVANDLAYDIPYAPYANGVDTNHLLLHHFNTKADNISYNRQGLNLNLAHLALKEKSGLEVTKLAAQIHYDSTLIDIADAQIETPHSQLEAMLHLPFDALSNNGANRLETKISGFFGKEDVVLFAGGAMGDFARQYPDKPLEIKFRAEGTANDAYIDYCHLTLPNSLVVRVSGKAHQIASELRRNGNLHYTVDLKDVSFIRPLLPHDLQKTIQIPNNLQLGGDIAFQGNTFNLSRNALYCGKGSLSFTGSFSAQPLCYNGKVTALQFPLQMFLPNMGLSPLTAEFDIDGRGTDFLNNGTSVTANGEIGSFVYDGISLGGITLKSKIDGLSAVGTLAADNAWLKGLLNFTAERKGSLTHATLGGTIDNLALSLGRPLATADPEMMQTSLIMDVRMRASYDSESDAINLGGVIDPLNAVTPTKGYPGGNIRFGIGATPDSTRIYFNSGDMTAFLRAQCPLENLISGFSDYATNFTDQFSRAQIDQDTLRALLPAAHLRLRVGHTNPIQQLMAMQGYEFDSLNIEMTTDPTNGVNGRAFVNNFKIGGILFEQTNASIIQADEDIKLNASVTNSSRKNPNKFAATIEGALHKDGFTTLANFKDANGREGLNIGARAWFDSEGSMRFRLIPEVSTLAYRQFKVNSDNFISITPDGMISADVDLIADDRTGLKLFSIPSDSANQDITLSITHLNLRDLSNVVPFLPQMGGLLNGDIHVLKENGKLTAVGALESTNLVYEGTPLGSLGTELFYMPEDSSHYVVAQILKDGNEVAVLDGHYYSEGDGKLDAQLTLDHLPTAMLNPMLGDDGSFALRGSLDGEINVTGPADRLSFNGFFMPDSIHVCSELYGFDLLMENKGVEIKDSKIKFENMALYAKSGNPLRIDGDADFGDFSNLLLDLSIKAKDFELINARKTKKSLVYGNVFVDLDATLKGKAGFMVLRGALNVLDKTNVTYVMDGGPLQVSDQFSGLVEFADFNEPADQKEELATIGGTFINLNISVSERAHLHCDLSTDGKSYVDCKGGGKLAFSIFPSGEMSLTGRFNINSGEMKYTLPFIPLKTFTFAEDNYIVFNGDVGNPLLNITALESTKAAVTDDSGASRMVNFKVGVAITRHLADMQLEFVINAPDDTEVQSELATMSTEMKNKLAVTMLATGMYVSSDNKAGFKANSALNAFLESEIQNIAGSALKTIDISVGVEGNTTSTNETQTDYTFQFSKKLWNDRIAIVIGGKVTTGATEETSSSQSFIDNISFEYRLDNNSTRYIRVFYDNDTYEPVEGRYSSAGAGYIMRRKTNNMGDLFIFKKRKK